MKIVFYVIFIIGCLSCKNENTNQRIQPSLSDVQESVYASVQIRPEASYFPQANRSGIIQNISIERGDTIKQGQILFKMLTANADTRLIDAKLSLDQAKKDYLGENNLLSNIKLELQLAEQQLQLDSINLKRQNRLWQQNIGAESDLDKAKIKFDASLNKYQALKRRYQQTAENLENSYKKALNLVENERTLLQDYVVRAEIDGRVYDIFKEVGELIGPQDRFAEIGSADNFKIEMDIDEIDITKISMGDTAIIALEAYPKAIFQSKITRIYPKKDEDTQTFRVEAVFLQEPPKIYNGLSGEANIIVAIRKDVLTIPTNYLKPDNMVETTTGEKSVITGIKNMDFVEIISGIDSATILINPNK